MMSGDAHVHVSCADAVMFGVWHGNKEREDSQNQDNQSDREQRFHRVSSEEMACNDLNIGRHQMLEALNGCLATLNVGETAAGYENSLANSIKDRTAIPDGPFAIQGLLSSIHAVPAMSR